MERLIAVYLTADGFKMWMEGHKVAGLLTAGDPTFPIQVHVPPSDVLSYGRDFEHSSLGVVVKGL